MRPFLPAILLVTLIAVTAPFLGTIRHAIFDKVPDLALGVLFIALALPMVGLLIYAVLRIRAGWRWQLPGLGLSAVLLAWQLHITKGDHGDITVSLVERVHIVEYGLLAWLLYRAFLAVGVRDASLLVLPLWGVAVGASVDEGAQFLASNRIGDIRDVGLDLVAGAWGLVLSLCLDPPDRFSWRIEKPRWVTDGLALAVLAMGGFFSVAHLGYWIHDPEIGSFRSWHTPEELIAAAEDRAQRWVEEKPQISPMHLEDLYLTEAGWHLGHRNRTYSIGQLDWALSANRILEKYYAPYLDLEDFAKTGRRRYSPRMLETFEGVEPRDPAEYTSPVLGRRLYTWPSRGTFQLLVGGAVLLLWGWPRRPAALRWGRMEES